MRIGRRSIRRASWTRRLGAVLVLGVLAAVAPALHPEPVSAASGVDDYPSRLKKAPQDSLVDPWRFYNRECTSFVAWRLNSENLVAFDDYWQGQHWGNASHWKSAAVALDIPVDNHPSRGAVAWWSAGSAGSSVGHVAWVETVGDGAITVEEYNYLHRGGYDTRTISSSSSLWPSGFIHIKDTQVRNTQAPAVSGTPQVGKKLTTTRGKWSAKGLTFSYQWLADGKPIAGATSRHLTLRADQVGKRIRAKVTATKSGAHSGSARSAATDGVAKGVFVSTAGPSVDGKAQVGVPLAADPGTWSPGGTIAYQWFSAGHPIDGATSQTFAPTADQLGALVRVRVTLSAPGYQTVRVRSDPTKGVLPGQFHASSPPTVSGVAQVDQPLTASAGTWTPAGIVSYQWLVDGKPVAGATGTAYTPRPDDVHQKIAIRVTVKQRGYDDAVATSVPTDSVAPGTFLNREAPSVKGTAQVGVTLTADKGRWSPAATIAYQWVVDGQPVDGATARTFTPRPEDVGGRVAVEVIASRPGYLTAYQTSDQTAPTLPGVIVNHRAPVVSGHAVVGRTLTSTSGSWSITPDRVDYQWYAGHRAIAGATQSTYVVTAAEAGDRIHVVVTAKHAGYTSTSAGSDSTARVVFGRISFAKPEIRGHAVVGRTLRVHVESVEPRTATRHYQWYRDSEPIHGARAATYVVTPADLGHRVHVDVTLDAENWISRTKRSETVTDIKTAPHVHVHPSMRGGRVFLRVTVSSPGLAAPGGTVHVWRGGTLVGRVPVVDGHGGHLLAPMRHGAHRLTLVYRGGPLEKVTRRTVTVTVS
jgi:surface antigen